jgi:hypothetical protein
MIRHMLLFSFKPAAGAEERQAMLDDLAALPTRYPKMQGMQIGPNISRRDDTFSHGMTFSFEDEADLYAYLDSAYHEQFVQERFRPLISGRAIVTLRL